MDRHEQMYLTNPRAIVITRRSLIMVAYFMVITNPTLNFYTGRARRK